MKITTLSVLFLIVSCLALWRTVVNLKRETIGIRSALIWTILWLSIGVFSIFPNLLNKTMRMAQMETRIIFILVIAVFILLALIFNLVSRMETMQRNLSKLVQEIALINSKIEENSNEDKEGGE
ncbi:MAG: DUF2304 domain-containing protein [Deltaproteobacteria bacterium]|nr:DUF2304 domain-containing protein [Deltaproteobacteria bacterium]MBW2333674.1 DUF2304 domain-containing protein [Deltaproteobacteria bacterium]